MASLEMKGKGSMDGVVQKLAEDIQNSGVSCTMVDSVDHLFDDTRVVVMVFEKYYWRANNRASLTVVVAGTNGEITVNAIGSGGGQGAFLSFSWGAEDSFVSVVQDSLNGMGF